MISNKVRSDFSIQTTAIAMFSFLLFTCRSSTGDVPSDFDCIFVGVGLMSGPQRLGGGSASGLGPPVVIFGSGASAWWRIHLEPCFIIWAIKCGLARGTPTNFFFLATSTIEILVSAGDCQRVDVMTVVLCSFWAVLQHTPHYHSSPTPY